MGAVKSYGLTRRHVAEMVGEESAFNAIETKFETIVAMWPTCDRVCACLLFSFLIGRNHGDELSRNEFEGCELRSFELKVFALRTFA